MKTQEIYVPTETLVDRILQSLEGESEMEYERRTR